MKKKYVIVLLIFTSIAFIIGNYIYAVNQEVSVYIDGEQITFDTKPIINDGRTMVPLRGIFEEMNMKVLWDEEIKKITVVKENLQIILYIGSYEATVNGKVIKIDVPPYIDNGRTMIPLRFIAESTGASVKWNGENRSVIITSNIENKIVDDVNYNQVVNDNKYTYPIVDTGITKLYTDNSIVSEITKTNSFYGQDAHYEGNQPSYTDNGNGTITDNITGLMWQKTMEEKMTYEEAVEYANNSNLGGYNDWRIPTIKELFSW